MIKSPAKPTALHSGPTRGTVPRPARRVVVKLLLSVVLIELIVMPIVGVVYYERFSAQIDSRYSERLETATALISRNRLNLTSLTDRETMSLLLGADLVDAMVITDQGLIAFSLDPAYRKKSIEAVDFLKGIVFDHDNTRPVLKRIQVGGHPYFVSLAALRGSGEHRVSSFLYFRVSEASAQREKANVALLLVLGLALTGDGDGDGDGDQPRARSGVWQNHPDPCHAIGSGGDQGAGRRPERAHLDRRGAAVPPRRDRHPERGLRHHGRAPGNAGRRPRIAGR